VNVKDRIVVCFVEGIVMPHAHAHAGAPRRQSIKGLHGKASSFNNTHDLYVPHIGRGNDEQTVDKGASEARLDTSSGRCHFSHEEH
jgi:hypothetical protein